jgi:predicted GNAT family acetyltransferase
MSAPTQETVVRHNAEEHRYEAHVGPALAGWSEYHEQPGLVTVLHTEVDPEYEGKGLGSQLVRGMLEDIRSRGLRVLPVCPFVGSYLQRHPEFAELVWKP